MQLVDKARLGIAGWFGCSWNSLNLGKTEPNLLTTLQQAHFLDVLICLMCPDTPR